MWAGIFPLDQEKGLEQVLWTAQAVSSYREGEEALQRLAGQFIPRSTIHRLVRQYGGILAQRQKEEAAKLWESGARKEGIPAPKEGQKKAMGIGIDGMMVWVEDGWHEVKVGCCFEFGPGPNGEVAARNIGVRIVDWYHAVEHLWGLGREAFGEKASEWVEKVKEWLWEGKGEEVVRECERVLEEKSVWGERVARTAEYFRQRREQMDDPAFREAGYPIGSGVVESACKGIGGRCKGRGQRWKSKGLEATLALRSAGMGGERGWNQACEQICQAA